MTASPSSTPRPTTNAQEVKEWRQDKAGYDSKYATLYCPWIKVYDPVAGQTIFVPPSGHIAGIWARNDGERGVHKAPANEVVRGALGLELNVRPGPSRTSSTRTGINCIRDLPRPRHPRLGRPHAVEPTRRGATSTCAACSTTVEKSILSGTQWVVFEPNDHRRSGSGSSGRSPPSCVRTWRDGALFGTTPAEAFYVKCDEETNPAETIDAGQLIVEIGIAPVKPAEFVIFRLAQFSGGTSLSE